MIATAAHRVTIALLVSIALGCDETSPIAPGEPRTRRWKDAVVEVPSPSPAATPTATPAPTPSPTPAATPTPNPTPTPRPTPIPTPTPLPLKTNLTVKKNRLGIPGGYYAVTPADMQALPVYGPVWTLEEYFDLLEREGVGVVLEGELVYYLRIADGGTYGRPAADGDWHLEVREPSNRTRAQSIRSNIVVEITPHFISKHSSWNEAGLSTLARFHGETQLRPTGARVRVYGWLMYDLDHEADAGSFRGSVWEVHPITRIEYFDDATSTWLELP